MLQRWRHPRLGGVPAALAFLVGDQAASPGVLAGQADGRTGGHVGGGGGEIEGWFGEPGLFAAWLGGAGVLAGRPRAADRGTGAADS